MKPKKTVVYRFKKKTGGSWLDVMDKDGTPLTITSDKHPSTIKHVLRARRPDIAYLHNVMDFEVWPDVEATNKLQAWKTEQEEANRKRWDI